MSTWVFLRGLTRDKRHWGDFPSVFTDHVVNAKVVCVDLAGNGELHHMASASRIEDMVAQCRGDLIASGYAPPYYLLALSLGAMVAVAWTQDYPDEIEGCVLMNTSLRIVSPFYSRLRVSAWPALLRTLFACGNPRGQERAIFNLTSSHAHLREQYVECWAQYRLQHPVTLRNALRQLLAAARYHASKVKPSIPILLLGGAGDRLVNPNCSVRLAKVWRAPLHFHPSAGHDLPLDDGIWVARKVAAWRSGGRPR